MALCFTAKAKLKFKWQTSYGLFPFTEIKTQCTTHKLNGKTVTVSSVCKAPKFQFKIKTNLSFEARINFGKLPETSVKAISLQNLHISEHIETMNIKKGYVTFGRNEFSVSPVSTELPNKLFLKFAIPCSFLTGR